ncbi:MAG: phosphate acyltransferase PlsX [Rhabdochlamydiaceae bacterium]|nr:phosphate acyltransferase PlsX [Rhabdochlamydiaceae bacterium]
MLDDPLQNKPHLIGVDLMGSDTPPEELATALIELREESFPAEFLLFVSPEVAGELPKNLPHIVCPETIEMHDDPILAVRRKKESSLCQGIQFLHEKKIDAFISAGNTGALLLAAKTKLKTLPNIDRPALLTLLPTHKKEVAVLDVGANLTLKSHHILQFAAMGIAYQKSRGIEHPTVGLLNIGTEAIKGTPQVREAYAKLETLNRDQPTFLGNIEGKDVFRGDIDVLVTDGFTGNVFLKTAEGLASFILKQLEQRAFEGSPSLRHEIASLKDRLYVAEHPGAILCGVEGIVVKCHGDITPAKFMSSIKGAARLVQHRFLEKIMLHLGLVKQ